MMFTLRTACLLSAVLLVGIGGISPVNGQVQGTIAVVTGTPDFYNCTAFDSAPALHTVYIFHRYPSARAVRFKIAESPDMTMTYVSESHHFGSTIGSARDGISVCYGECASEDQLLVTMTYMSYGTSGPCSKILVVPHPDAQTVDAIECDGVPVRTEVEDLWVSTPSAPCSGCPPPGHTFAGTAQTFDCTPVSVVNTTWGAIKALYTN